MKKYSRSSQHVPLNPALQAQLPGLGVPPFSQLVRLQGWDRLLDPGQPPPQEEQAAGGWRLLVEVWIPVLPQRWLQLDHADQPLQQLAVQ